jgi:hypothetical protein
MEEWEGFGEGLQLIVGGWPLAVSRWLENELNLFKGIIKMFYVKL